MAKFKVLKPRPQPGKSSQRLASDSQIVALRNSQQDILAMMAQQKQLLIEQQVVVDAYLGQLAEINLRVRFVMDHFKFSKGATIAGPDGRPLDVEVRSLYELYLLNRTQFMLQMERDNEQIARADQRPETGQLASTSDGRTPAFRGIVTDPSDPGEPDDEDDARSAGAS